ANNWVKPALAGPVVNKPGSKFLYNNLGPFLLSAIIQKVTGQKLIDYLKPRLFIPLDIKEADYETNPQGINVGGYGLRLNIESMAKFGQLFLQKGKWKGRQVLSAEWIAEATKIQIGQPPSYVSEAQKPTSDWAQGYGYFFWRCRNNAYRADGAMGQFIVVMPDQDAVVALTANAPDMQAELNLVWDHLLPAMKAGKLKEDRPAQTALKSKLTALALSLPPKTANGSSAKAISGKTFIMEPNSLKIQSVSLEFKGDLCMLKLKTDASSHDLSFGSGYWAKGQTTRHGPSLTFGSKGSLKGLPAFKVAGAYTWKDDDTLEMLLRYTESVHSQLYKVKIVGDVITLEVPSPLNPGMNVTIKSVQ
ncbi:MAG TPA: serine hydrolase, partial [Pedobacter sp.]|uniref:serine hydrolase domain-containing protein n=1 Tax=Pedobacter sp. TaxID=1411316 RepID=UPI002D0D72FE